MPTALRLATGRPLREMGYPHVTRPASADAENRPRRSDRLGGTILGDDGKSIPVERQARTNRLPFLAAAINAEHRAAFGAAEKALEHAAGCGRHLIEAKALVPHGDWLPWLKANTEVVPRQSQKYMRLANHWEQVSAKSELGGSHLALNDALQLIADPKPKPQPKRRCISAAEIGEVTLIHRGWIPDFTPKGGGGPWPSDIAAFYAECAKIGPPFEVLTWQRKAAKFHWSGWLPEEESEGKTVTTMKTSTRT